MGLRTSPNLTVQRIASSLPPVRRIPKSAALPDQAIERAIQQLRDFNRRKGLRNSTVRETVARTAMRRRGHFSVEELVSEIRGEANTEIHAATVYRIMPLLVEAGLLRITLVSTGDGALYERSFEREHHDHLICTECGAVVEFHFEAIEVLQRDLAERFGFRLTSHIHELLGLCAKCRSQDAAANRKASSLQ